MTDTKKKNHWTITSPKDGRVLYSFDGSIATDTIVGGSGKLIRKREAKDER